MTPERENQTPTPGRNLPGRGTAPTGMRTGGRAAAKGLKTKAAGQEPAGHNGDYRRNGCTGPGNGQRRAPSHGHSPAAAPRGCTGGAPVSPRGAGAGLWAPRPHATGTGVPVASCRPPAGPRGGAPATGEPTTGPGPTEHPPQKPPPPPVMAGQPVPPRGALPQAGTDGAAPSRCQPRGIGLPPPGPAQPLRDSPR